MASIFVVFGGRSSPLAGRLADEAKSCVVKSELLRQGMQLGNDNTGRVVLRPWVAAGVFE